MRKSFLRIALLLPLLTACTKEVVDDVNNGDYTDPQALSLNSDASQLASRLVMTGSKASRSAARSVAEKPAAPSLPTEYKQMPADGILKNQMYIADSFSGTIRCNESISASIYVTGEMTVTGIEGNPTELCIYVMEGAKLTWNMKDYFGFLNFPENKNLIVKSWGELTTGLTDHKGLRIYKGSSLHIINQTGSVLETQELMVEGKITSYVPVRVITKATISNGAKVNFHADAEIKNVNEDSANILDVSGGSEVYFGGCTYIGGEPVKHGAGSDMKVDGKSVLSIEKYLSVNGVVYVSGESRLNLLNKNSIFFNSQDMYLGMSEDPMLTGGHIYVGALCVAGLSE